MKVARTKRVRLRHLFGLFRFLALCFGPSFLSIALGLVPLRRRQPLLKSLALFTEDWAVDHGLCQYYVGFRAMGCEQSVFFKGRLLREEWIPGEVLPSASRKFARLIASTIGSKDAGFVGDDVTVAMTLLEQLRPWIVQRERALELNSRWGAPLLPLGTDEGLLSAVRTALGGAVRMSSIPKEIEVRVPDLDPADVQRILNSFPDSLTLGAFNLELDWRERKPTITFTDAALRAKAWRLFGDVGPALRHVVRNEEGIDQEVVTSLYFVGLFTMKPRGELRSFGATDLPTFLEGYREMANDEQFDCYTFESPETILVADVKRGSKLPSRPHSVVYGTDPIRTAPLYAYPAWRFDSGLRRFHIQWFRNRDEAEFAQDNSEWTYSQLSFGLPID